MVAFIIIIVINRTCESAWNIAIVCGRMLVFSNSFLKSTYKFIGQHVPINLFTDSYYCVSFLSCTM